MQYVIGLAVLLAVLAAALVYRRLKLRRTARHRADIDVPSLWSAWRQRSRDVPAVHGEDA